MMFIDLILFVCFDFRCYGRNFVDLLRFFWCMSMFRYVYVRNFIVLLRFSLCCVVTIYMSYLKWYDVYCENFFLVCVCSEFHCFCKIFLVNVVLYMSLCMCVCFWDVRNFVVLLRFSRCMCFCICRGVCVYVFVY